MTKLGMLFGELRANWPTWKPRRFHMQMLTKVFRQRYELAYLHSGDHSQLPFTYPYRKDRVANAEIRQ